MVKGKIQAAAPLGLAGVIVPFALAVSSCQGGGATSSALASAAVQSTQLRSIPVNFDFVTSVYGSAIVREGDYSSPNTQVVPWTGYWFPKRKKEMFMPDPATGELSPLQRYDQWARRVKGVDSHAADIEAQAYDPDAEAWEGLCNAWSSASIQEPAPMDDAVVDGVPFRAADLKALLIKTYDGPPQGFTQYGQRFQGTYGDDFLDLYPDQFHRFLQVQLFDKAQPFVMDKDAGVEVWNVPVFAAESRVSGDPADPHVMHVTTWVTFANFVYSFDYNGGTQPVTIEYFYDLFGNRLADGSFEVHSGFWTGDSLENHPDFVTVLPSNARRQSYNTGLKSEWVDEIVAAAMAGRTTTSPEN
ncbi:MAG: hypothetical protein P4M08_08600 [Oligoflexia bacterium]|nr:hypothetical protein [Oligoflexia bacterium]